MSFILFGSQTGQAKSIAENIYDVIGSKNISLKLFELDDIDKSYKLEEVKIAIIICSTTGDGDAPENASKFLRKIKSYSINSLSSFRYTILGLGDTNYSNFCKCGKTIDDVLYRIGGQRFYNSKWADDAVGLELVVEPWLEGLFKVMAELSGHDLVLAIQNINILDEINYENKVKPINTGELLGESVNDSIADKVLSVPLPTAPFLNIMYDITGVCSVNHVVVSTAPLPADKSGLRYAGLSDITKITAKYAVKDVHMVTLSLENNSWSWLPGDSIGVLSCNPQSEVDAILSRLGVSPCNAHCPISFGLIPGNHKKIPKIPEHLIVQEDIQISLHNALSWLCDIRSPLSKAGLRLMAEYCPVGSAEERRLLQLCSKEGQILYIRCIREPHMPLLDLLNWFPSCTVPVERLLEVLPRLKPRAYSLCDLNMLRFAFSKVDIAPVSSYRKRPLTGVCTTWLESLVKLTKPITLPVYLRKNLSGFTVTNPRDPHILIGPGTGVAPFIGFLQYFEKLKKEGEVIGEVWLFFGCRHRERDFIFRDELEYFVREGVLSHLCVCFSRDVGGGGDRGSVCVPAQCKYVQDCLAHHGPELSPLVLDQGARVFVCGDASGLAKDVLAAWPKVLLAGAHASVTTAKEAEACVTKMRIDKRYLEDVWL